MGNRLYGSIFYFLGLQVYFDHDGLNKNDDGVPINETFHDEYLLTIASKELPWFADIANYLVSGILPYGMDYRQRKKFLHDSRFYYWEETLLYKRCAMD